MRKNQKKVLILILSTVLIIICIFYYFFVYKKNQAFIYTDSKPIDSSILQLGKQNLSPTLSLVRVGENADTKTIQVSLSVLGKTYDTEVKENSTVFDVMKKMEGEGMFNFKFTENPGMGAFVTEINGAKGKPGEYWLYYVNDKKATVGISNYTLKNGDIINWKQE